MTQHRHPQSPRLDHCPETLPQAAYLSADWYARELQTVFARNWISAGRLADLAPGTMRRVQLGAASTILCRAKDGALSAFHNACRHRGSELCRHDEQPLGKLITCPYHAWSYAADNGRLVSTAHAQPRDDFSKQDNGLHPVSVMVWNGFVFLNLAENPGPLRADVAVDTLNNWPMDSLITGHRATYDLACNWKVFWENYSECLHCPGIHPELCDLVPIYGRGIMGQNEALGWTPDQPRTGNLKSGAESWTMTGAPCGPVFPNLTAEQRQNGYTFVTFWLTMYVVAHVDYVRSVRVEPTGPETTRLIAEWHFPQATLDQPGFDAAEVAAFAKIVLAQDGDAAEMNQRGIRSPSYTHGRLMPEEYEIAHFHQWLLKQMEVAE
jgi:Rieske 2Fe-2S family protein